MASDRKTKSVKATRKKASPRKSAKAPAEAASGSAKKKRVAKKPARKALAEMPAAKATQAKPMTTKKPSRKAAPKPPKTAKTKTEPAASKAAAKPKKAAAAKPKAPPKPRKPRKPVVDPELLKAIRDALVYQRNSLLSVVQSTQAQLAQKAVGLADISDRASGANEDDLAMGLMKIEAAKIGDIQAAIKRIDEDAYGVCVDCQKAIPRKRLEVLPFALRCLACEGMKERRARLHIPDDD